jgi:hypothetical protein
MPTVGVDRFEDRAARHMISHTMEMMLAAMSVIWGGVCERHPRIRLGFLESGGGWIAPWLDRMDRHFDDQAFNNSGLKTRPSNCWISFEPVEGSLSVLADYIGPHKIMWATDYPTSDAADDRKTARAIVARGEASGFGREHDGGSTVLISSSLPGATVKLPRRCPPRSRFRSRANRPRPEEP